MKTAIRRPKIRKPVKGMRMFLKQGMSNIKQVIKSVIPKPKQWYYTHSQMRSMWLTGLRGSHRPHQGAQEKARRVLQMACGFIKA
jgi:hypothetical protein